MANNIAISWESKNHAENNVYDTFIELLKEKENINIDEKYIFYSDKISEKGEKKTEVKINTGSITDHKEIYNGVKKEIDNIYNKHQGSKFFINISPGTPAMHSVWLVLYADGSLPDTTLFQTQQYGKEKKNTRLDAVKFDINTYLQNIKEIKRTSKEAFYAPDYKYESEKLNDVLSDLKKMSNINAPVLVLGERGTGKTRFAEKIFKAYKNKEVITVNCGSLSETLGDSELFGHKQGAFTGAVKDRDGYIKKADKNILFLDEIQDLSKTSQRKLVRFLESKKYRPIGSDDEETSDAILIFASNKPYKELVSILDNDLFDRISLLTITIPPLRECVEDIDKFISDIWQELEKAENLPDKINLSQKQKKEIIKTGLSGNFRSLKSLLSYIAVEYNEYESLGKAIDLAIEKWKPYQENISANEKPDISWLLGIEGKKAIQKVQYALASHYYDKNNKNAVKAADELKINNTTLKNWLDLKE